MQPDTRIGQLKDALLSRGRLTRAWHIYEQMLTEPWLLGLSFHRRQPGLERSALEASLALGLVEAPANQFLTLRYAQSDLFHGRFRQGKALTGFIYLQDIRRGVLGCFPDDSQPEIYELAALGAGW